MSWPRTNILPDVGMSWVAYSYKGSLSNPFLPSIVNIWFESIHSEISFKAGCLEPLYDFVNPNAQSLSNYTNSDLNLE